MTTVPHTLTITDTPDGREADWTHPETCPDGNACDILRRSRRMSIEGMGGLTEGRPAGAYLLGRFGFHGLLLVDENGSPLPDIIEALSPAEQAARQIAADVIRELAEGICEETERLVELCEIIRRGQTMTHRESAANDAINTIISENLGAMRPYAEPVDRLLGDAA